MRFELIDQIIDQQADRIVAIKNVTTAEEYLGDHFPGFAVLPGVMMLETLVQAARKLLIDRPAPGTTPGNGPWVIEHVKNVRYGNMVRPGQMLSVEVQLRGESDGGYDFQGVGKVNEQIAVQGRFRLARIPERT